MNLSRGLRALALSSMLACAAPRPPFVCREHVTTADLASPVVSFRNDVQPVFRTACAFSSCHGSDAGGNNGVYLGEDAPRVIRALVGVASEQLTTSKLVAAGDPKASYLMRKVDGDACLSDTSCIEGTCGGSMPKDNPILPEADRDTLRRWIAQGAKND